jgi:RNA recognition motif-containing protein
MFKAIKDLTEKNVDGRPLKVTLSKGAPSYEETKPSTIIFIGNLPAVVTVPDFKEFLETYGPVKDIRLVNDRMTGEFKRASFIEFESQDSATKMFDSQPISFKSCELKVDYAVPLSEKRPRPMGGFRGGRGGFRGGRGGFRGGRGGRGGK